MVVDLIIIRHPEADPGAFVTVRKVSVQAAVVVQNAHGNVAARGGWVDSDVEAADPEGQQLIPHTGGSVQAEVCDLVEAVGGLDSHDAGVSCG